jgi:hypothetical protein
MIQQFVRLEQKNVENLRKIVSSLMRSMRCPHHMSKFSVTDSKMTEAAQHTYQPINEITIGIP